MFLAVKIAERFPGLHFHLWIIFREGQPPGSVFFLVSSGRNGVRTLLLFPKPDLRLLGELNNSRRTLTGTLHCFRGRNAPGISGRNGPENA